MTWKRKIRRKRYQYRCKKGTKRTFQVLCITSKLVCVLNIHKTETAYNACVVFVFVRTPLFPGTFYTNCFLQTGFSSLTFPVCIQVGIAFLVFLCLCVFNFFLQKKTREKFTSIKAGKEYDCGGILLVHVLCHRQRYHYHDANRTE